MNPWHRLGVFVLAQDSVVQHGATENGECVRTDRRMQVRSLPEMRTWALNLREGTTMEIDGVRLVAYFESGWRGRNDSENVAEMAEQIHAQLMGWA